MTGFTSWIRRILFIGPARDAWVEAAEDCTPARLKLSVKNRLQFEIKIVYQLNPNCKKQQYRVELFIFFSKELESLDLGFYHNLWNTVRLHTPKAPISELKLVGPGTKLGQIAEAIEALEMKLKSATLAREGREAETSALLQLLRLHCSCIRRSLRSVTRKLHGQIRRAAKDGRGGKLQRAAADVMLLVEHLIEAIEATQAECVKCSSESMPLDVTETWSLSNEFLLCETERCLLKLLLELQDQTSLSRTASRQIEISWASGENGFKPEQQGGDSNSQPAAVLLSDSEVELASIDSADRIAKARFQPHGSQKDLEVCQSTSASSSAASDHHKDPLQRAYTALGEAIERLQSLREESGFSESIIRPDSDNEKYTNRVKVLKRHALAANSLTPQKQAPSNALADMAGMTVAALAMSVAVFSVYAAEHWAGSRYGLLYLAILVGAYVVKDRMKEWGKRYLQPAAEWFGLDFPDTITNFVDWQGRRVGQSRQSCSIKEDTGVDKRVLEMRWRDSWIPTQRHAAKPEKVVVYRKRMAVHWKNVTRQLRSVTGLDDVMRIDLHHFCRRMVPPTEEHHRLVKNPDGTCRAEIVQCSRVYHLNLVLRMRSQSAATDKDAEAGKLMRLEKARLVVNQQGILRLEPLGAMPLQKHLSASKSKVAFRRLSASPLWKAFQRQENGAEQARTDIEAGPL